MAGRLLSALAGAARETRLRAPALRREELEQQRLEQSIESPEDRRSRLEFEREMRRLGLSGAAGAERIRAAREPGDVAAAKTPEEVEAEKEATRILRQYGISAAGRAEEVGIAAHPGVVAGVPTAEDVAGQKAAERRLRELGLLGAARVERVSEALEPGHIAAAGRAEEVGRAAQPGAMAAVPTAEDIKEQREQERAARGAAAGRVGVEAKALETAVELERNFAELGGRLASGTITREDPLYKDFLQRYERFVAIYGDPSVYLGGAAVSRGRTRREKK